MKNKIHILLIIKLLIVSLTLFYACDTKNTQQDNTTEEAKEPALVLKPSPKFSGDTAYQFVKKQVDFGPRVPNTEAHRKCADFLKNTLQSFGWQVIVQDFDAMAYNGRVLKSKNIIGMYNPQAPTRILLAAHWDTRPFNDKEVKDTAQYKPIDGANDGGSGVGVLLEIARIIQQTEKKPAIGIDIIFFDSEDYGQPEGYVGEYKPDTYCLGSQYWGKNKHKADYQAYFGILLDMVGAKGAQFYREGTSMEKAAEVTNMVWKVANQLNYGQYFKMLNSPGITDDHTYVNELAKIPMLDIVEYDPHNKDSFFGHYHHTQKDNMSIIDPKTLEAVGQTVLQVLYNQTAQ
jgi:glutaminyl-peptide cyclotransferase